MDINNTSTESNSPDLQQVISLGGDLFRDNTKKRIEEEYQQRRQDATFVDYVKDIPTGVAAGVEGFAKSVGKLGADVFEGLGGEHIDDSYFESTIRTTTLAGDLTKGVTQFALAMAPISGGVGWLTKGVELSRAARLGLTFAKGAAADFTAFQGHEERLSNLIQDWPVLGNPVTKYLAASPEDSDAEGRFKNSLEGMGLGLAFEMLHPILRAFKKVKAAPTAEAATKAWEEAQAEVAKSAKVAEYRDTILSITDKVTPDQVDSTLTLWAKIARQKGIPLDEFLDKRLAGIVTADPQSSAEAIARRLKAVEPGVVPTASTESVRSTADVSSLMKEKEDLSKALEAQTQSTPPTPVTSESITPGVFHQNANGWVRFVNDTQALIGLSKTADVSTLLHESFHVWRRYDLEPNTLQSLEKAMGVGSEGWTREMEEKAARLFERFLYDGTVPDGAPSSLFGKFKEWMGNVYGSLHGSPIEGDVSPEVQKALGKIFGEDSKPLINDAIEMDGARRPITDFLLQKNPTSVPESVTNAFHEAFIKNKGRGLEDSQALQDTLDSWMNLSRLNTPEDHKAFVMNTLKLMDEWNFKGVGEVQRLKMVEDGAKDYFARFGQSVDATLASAAKDVRNMDLRLQSRFVFYKMAAEKWSDELQTMIQNLSDNPPSSAIDAITQKWQSVASLRHMVDFIQTQGARLPSAGRIVVGIEEYGISAKLDKVKDILNGSDVTAKTKLLTTMKAAGVDPRAFDRVLAFFDGKGKSAFKKVLDIHLEFWMNAILSGMKTMTANVIGNLHQSLVLPAERIAGGAFLRDKAVMDSGFRLYANLLHTATDIFQMTDAGLRINPESAIGGALKSFREDRPLIDASVKEATPRAISSKNLGLEGNPFASAIDHIGTVVNLPSRIQTSVDDFFKQINVRAYLREKGMREATSKGLEKDSLAFGQYVNEFVAKAFDKDGAVLDEAAREYGRQSTFTTQMMDGSWGKTLQQIGEKHPTFRLFVPFIKTPTNIFTRAVQYTPGLQFLSQEMREMWRHPDPLVQAQARGRMMIGGLFWGTAVGFAASGRLTGGGPSSPEERNQLMATGWQPYSLVITGADGKKEYISFKRIDPQGMLLGLAADFAEIGGHLSDEDLNATASAMGIALAQNLSSKTYLTGIAQVVNALSQPDRNMEKFLEDRAGSYIPNFLAQANNDPYLREARGIVDAVKRRIPGFSESLAPRRNLLGEPVTPTGGWMPFSSDSGIARMASPLAYSKSVNDPVKDEIARLSHGFSPPRSTFGNALDLRSITNGTGQDAYDYWQEQHGKVRLGGRTMAEALNKLVTSKQYQSIDPETNSEQRLGLLQGVVGQYREAAKQQMLKAYPQITKQLNDYKRAKTTPSTSPVLERLKAAG